jgi:hypothetical protein
MSYAQDTASEVGDDMYRTPTAMQAADAPDVAGARASSGGLGGGPSLKGRKGATAVETADVSVGQGWGRGPMSVDTRKFRFDVRRGKASPALSFSASKADRMDAEEAGDLLHRIHAAFHIDAETEDRLVGFNNALFLEHALNGASLLQPGRGTLKVAKMSFDIQVVKSILGIDQRRFFRAFADEITDVVRGVLRDFDPMDPESAEVYGQLSQIAVERGLTKFPYLVHDSADAGVMLSNDERNALIASKRFVLRSTVNNVDKMPTHDDARMQYETGITT